MSMITVQLHNDMSGELEELSFENTQTVRQVLENYLEKKNIRSSLDSGALVCEAGNGHIRITDFDSMRKPLSNFVKDGDLLVLKLFSRDFENEACTMTDPTKDSCQRGFSKTAPKWRIIHKGLNVFGACKNPKCEAHKKTVIVRKDNETVDFAKDQFDFPCPICQCPVKPKTVAFYLCQYKIYGKKDEGSKVVPFGPIKGDAKDPKYHTYYDPEANHDATFTQYVVEIPKIY